MPTVTEESKVELSDDAKQRIEDIATAAMCNIMVLAQSSIQAIIVDATKKISEQIQNEPE